MLCCRLGRGEDQPYMSVQHLDETFLLQKAFIQHSDLNISGQMNGEWGWMGMNGDQLLPIHPQADEWGMNNILVLSIHPPFIAIHPPFIRGIHFRVRLTILNCNLCWVIHAIWEYRCLLTVSHKQHTMRCTFLWTLSCKVLRITYTLCYIQPIDNITVKSECCSLLCYTLKSKSLFGHI